MTKTVLTELIEFADDQIDRMPPSSVKDSSVAALVAGMEKIKQKAISLLSKEESQLEHAFEHGQSDGFDALRLGRSMRLGSKYIETNYNKYTPQP